MGAALSIFVLLSVSVFVIRIASVALRLTGLPDDTARFQALSAFTGTGFTTAEAESIVNYPVRRRIASLLMIIGNIGLVGVLATVVASLVHTDGDPSAVLAQLAWLLTGLALLWFLMLNATADRLLCALIGRVLKATTLLGERRFHRLIQIGTGYSICEHPVSPGLLAEAARTIDGLDDCMTVLGKRAANGVFTPAPVDGDSFADGEVLAVFAADAAHEWLEAECNAGDSSTAR